MPNQALDRRRFLQSAGTLALSAASYAGVVGSNRRIGIGFIGCGGRAQAHINAVVKLSQENRGVSPMAVCDVWDGLDDEYEQANGSTMTKRRYSQGLFPAAKKCGLNPSDGSRCTKDYRRLLDLKDVDAVCIATPDHWHAKQTLDAFEAGKDVLVERPMTRTAAEASEVRLAAANANRILVVGVQSLMDPTWQHAAEAIRSGAIGRVIQVAGGAFRSDPRGLWRFYRIAPQMTPRTIDWSAWLGSAGAGLPFDAATFAQWRCVRPFGSGPLGELFAPVLSRLLAASGLTDLRRVVASGGLLAERDGRTVPDTATLIAEFGEGAQIVLSTCTANDYPVEEVIRGTNGTIKFAKGGYHIFRDGKHPSRLESELKPSETVRLETPRHETESLWVHFLDCARTRQPSLQSGPGLGGLVSTILANAAEQI